VAPPDPPARLAGVSELPPPSYLVLASGSPRRRELLERSGFAIVVRTADVDETILPGEIPTAHVRRLASLKRRSVPVEPGEAILAADTIVEFEGEILGKPAGPEEAAHTLRRLSGRTHRVHTAVSAAHGTHEGEILVTTEVTMDTISEASVDWYVLGGEPLDKAGSYAIQGAAAAFVRSVRGSVTNVIGLPLAETITLLGGIGLDVDALRLASFGGAP